MMKKPIRRAALTGAIALFICTGTGAANLDRHIPDGTLTYRIVLDGHGGEPPKFPMLFDEATLHRSVEVKTRMKGDVATPADAGKPNATVQDLAKQAEA